MFKTLKDLKMWLAIKLIDKKFWKQVNKEKQMCENKGKDNG